MLFFVYQCDNHMLLFSESGERSQITTHTAVEGGEIMEFNQGKVTKNDYPLQVFRGEVFYQPQFVP